MCELMTVAAAVVFTVLYFRYRDGKFARSLFNTMMMFWGAALMWSVDCVFSFREGEGFFDLSAKDALLGVIILACGLGYFAFAARKQFAIRNS